MQKLGVGVVFFSCVCSLFVEAKVKGLCRAHLIATQDVQAKDTDTLSSFEDIDTIMARVSKQSSAELLAHLTEWLKMHDSRPDLVASATVRLLDAVSKKELSKESVYLAFVENIESIINATAVESSYAFLHRPLLSFLYSNLELNNYAKVASFVYRERSQSRHVYRTEVLDGLESIVLAYGYKKKFYTLLAKPQSQNYLAAHQWNLLRSQRLEDIPHNSSHDMQELLLSERSFTSQLSHYLALHKSIVYIEPLLRLLDKDPFVTSAQSLLIQREVMLLADPQRNDALPVFSSDFSTHLALRNITRSFMLMKTEQGLGKNLDSFFEYFKSPNAPRQVDANFMNFISMKYASFINLAIAWEAVIEWNLESKSKWAVSEEHLLQQARLVPDFIFRYVYQETRSSRMRAFLTKLDGMR